MFLEGKKHSLACLKLTNKFCFSWCLFQKGYLLIAFRLKQHRQINYSFILATTERLILVLTMEGQIIQTRCYSGSSEDVSFHIKLP